MNITLLAIGKNKDKALQGLIDDYIKRLPWSLTIKEMAPPNCTDAERKRREAELIRAALPPKSFIIALDERGEALDSVGFARFMEKTQGQSPDNIVFLIGGADGLEEALRNDTQARISFGCMTWPHMLVRLMLAEQLYRASTILAGHPYHRV